MSSYFMLACKQDKVKQIPDTTNSVVIFTNFLTATGGKLNQRFLPHDASVPNL